MMTEGRQKGKHHYSCVPGTLLEDTQVSRLTHMILGRGLIIASIYKDAEIEEQSLVNYPDSHGFLEIHSGFELRSLSITVHCHSSAVSLSPSAALRPRVC